MTIGRTESGKPQTERNRSGLHCLDPPSHPDTYALLLTSKITSLVRIGKLGTLKVDPGFYVYIGSAFGPGGLRSRIAHHRKVSTRPHWHINYLRSETSLQSAWYTRDAVKRKHLWAAVMREMPGAIIPLARFGASDCTCPAHLFYFAEMFKETCFEKLISERCAGHGDICEVVS